MRSYAIVLGLLASATALTGCKGLFSPDNYDEPGSTLTGSVTYQGQPVPVATEQVELDIWQPGFDFEENIPVYVDQDGTFTAVLFNGDYEINLRNGVGPWVDNSSRMSFTVSGSTTIEVPVTPYYTVGNANIVNSGDVVQATFTVNSVNTGREVNFVGLYVSTTQFVDRTNQVVRVERNRADIPDLNGTINLSVALPSDIRVRPGPEPRTAVFARVGIAIVGKEDMVFSEVLEVGL